MPRKKNDILKDLFIAHRNNDEELYNKTATEFLRYLRDFKNHHKVADEFEEIFFPKKAKENEKNQFSLFNEKNIAKNKNEKKDISKSKKDSNKEKNYVLQVSAGGNVDFVLARKVLDTIINSNKSSITTKDIMDILLCSEHKAKGFARILYFFGLLEDKTRKLTPLVKLITKYDPYFEDIGTLWFLHYYISSQDSLIVWNIIVNKLMLKNSFKYDDLDEYFDKFKSLFANKSVQSHKKEAFDFCIDAYTDAELSSLNLFNCDPEYPDVYIKKNPASVPDKILLASILLYLERHYPNSVAIEIKFLLGSDNTPGLLFYMNEFRFRECLERLRISNLIQIESFADLDQIKFSEDLSYIKCLELYYKDKFM